MRENYQIPDLTFVARGRESIIAEDGIRHGAPDAIIEIRSPDDETYEKLPFFAELGVSEVIVVDRDTKRPEIYKLTGPQYLVLQADRDDWMTSLALKVRFKSTGTAAGRPVLVIEDASDPSKRTDI